LPFKRCPIERGKGPSSRKSNFIDLNQASRLREKESGQDDRLTGIACCDIGEPIKAFFPPARATVESQSDGVTHSGRRFWFRRGRTQNPWISESFKPRALGVPEGGLFQSRQNPWVPSGMKRVTGEDAVSARMIGIILADPTARDHRVNGDLSQQQTGGNR
jgi:hypothetical protein